uniref:Amidohydro-rel domain-containing protein n=1 Tax=Strongyloides venezuelensis TaxID=75913 RepID=A0A0K0EVB3_STRVS
MFPFLPFLTFPKNDREGRRREEYLAIKISSETGLPIFKRKNLPISFLPHKDITTSVERKRSGERTNKCKDDKCQINISNDNNSVVFENFDNQHDIKLTTNTPQLNTHIECNINDGDVKQNMICIDNISLNVIDVDKSNVVLLSDDNNKLLDKKLNTDILEESRTTKQSSNGNVNIANDVNKNNLLPATDLQTSFYLEKLKSMNLDDISEDEIFGKSKKSSLTFNPSFKESSPIPEDDHKVEESIEIYMEKDETPLEELLINKDKEETPIISNEAIFIKKNKKSDDSEEEIMLERSGKLIHSPVPPKNIKSSQNVSSSRQDITRNKKEMVSPRDTVSLKSTEKKLSNERIASPLLKASTSNQRIHSISPRQSSSSQTNLSTVRKISSSGRLSSPNSKNIQMSNDKIERLSHLHSRPMERLTDMGRTKSTPPNVLKQQSNSTSSKVQTPPRQSNRNPFAVSEAMLSIFGTPPIGGVEACFNKIPPPNLSLSGKNFKRSNILERDLDQLSIFPNTKPLPGPSSSSSSFNIIPDHEKAYEEAKKRSNWKATDSAFEKIHGVSCGSEIICGPERDICNEDDELNNDGILVVEESTLSITPRFSNQKETYNKNTVCEQGADIYGEDDNEDNNCMKIEERKTSVNEINTNECLITCKDGVDKAYDHMTNNFPEDVKINWCHNKEEDSICNQKDNQFYGDKSCKNTIYNSIDYGNTLQVNITSPSLQYTTGSSIISQTTSSDGVLSQNNDKVSNIIDNIINNQTIISSGESKNDKEGSDNLSQKSSTSGINNDSEDDNLFNKNLQKSGGDVASDKMVKPGDCSSSGSGIPLLIKNGKIINDDSSFIANILVEDATITQIGNQFPIPDGCQVIDATNKIIIPAGIDIHTEFCSSTSVDDFLIGSKAAIAGGTTTIIDVAIPRNESESLLSAFERAKSLISGKCQCNAALSVMILSWNSVIQREMECLVKEKGVNNFILNISSCADDQLFEIMEHSKKLGALLRVSPENNSIIKILERKMLNLGVTGPEGYCQSRPIQLETERITNLGTLSQLSNCPISIVSLTSSEGCQALQTSNINGGLLTAEIPIVALTQNGDIYYDKNLAVASTFIIRNPLRPGRQHAISLLNTLSSLPLAICVSDHKATKNYDRLKVSDFTRMTYGIPAVEERLPVLWEKGVCSGVINYMRFVAVTSSNAAKAFNLYPRKGRIEVGADADLTILDTTVKRQLTVKNQMSSADFNAFEQMNVHCQVVVTICGGNILYQDGKLLNNGNTKQNDMYLPLLPNTPHLFSQVQQRERMAGRVEKVERDEGDSRKSSISSTGGVTPNVRGQKINAAFQTTFDTRPISGSGVRNQFESTLNQPLPPNPSRSGTKVKNPPGGRSTGFW